MKKQFVCIMCGVFLLALCSISFAVEYVDSVSGTVTYNGSPVNAMVLANGKYTFSTADTGAYLLEDVPLAGDGSVTLFSFCEGLAPFKTTFTPAGSDEVANVAMLDDSGSDPLDVSAVVVEGDSELVSVAGFVTSKGEAVNAMMLSNGQYVFSSAADGTFHIENVPVDANNNVTLFGFAESKAPFKIDMDTVDLNFTFTNAYGQTFQRIPAGTFTMGSPQSEDGRMDNETQHQVMITNDYYIMTEEVTQGQWKSIMGTSPSSFNNCGDDCPVENITWSQAQTFLNTINNLTGTDTYRLPTEAEWEYACRAGSQSAFYNGDISYAGLQCGEDATLNEVGWYCYNSNSTTHSGAQKQGNIWGLYDMHGNVAEFTGDWFGTYPSAMTYDPAGPPTGTSRVARGGGVNAQPSKARSAARTPVDPTTPYPDMGLRLVKAIVNPNPVYQWIPGEWAAAPSYKDEDATYSQNLTLVFYINGAVQRQTGPGQYTNFGTWSYNTEKNKFTLVEAGYTGTAYSWEDLSAVVGDPTLSGYMKYYCMMCDGSKVYGTWTMTKQ